MARTKTNSPRKKKCNGSRHVEKGAKRSGLGNLVKWNSYYSSNLFPIIVCCDKCSKWRKTFEFEEKWEVPESWNCSMWKTSNGRRGNCELPSAVNPEDYVDEDYTPGSMVWAKMTGYDEWPAIIEDDPIIEEYCKDLETTKPKYHVVFLGDPPSRRWIGVKQLKPFEMPSADEVRTKYSKRKKLGQALKEAKKADKMTKQDRLVKFSFGARYRKQKNTVKRAEPVSLKNILINNKRAFRSIIAKSARRESVVRNKIVKINAARSALRESAVRNKIVKINAGMKDQFNEMENSRLQDDAVIKDPSNRNSRETRELVFKEEEVVIIKEVRRNPTSADNGTSCTRLQGYFASSIYLRKACDANQKMKEYEDFLLKAFPPAV